MRLFFMRSRLYYIRKRSMKIPDSTDNYKFEKKILFE